MSKRSNLFRSFLTGSGVRQAEIARATELTTGYVSLLVNGETGASQNTIDAILAFLTARLGRPVTYEEVFGAKTARVFIAGGGRGHAA